MKFKIGITNFVTFLRVVGIILLIPIYRNYGGMATFVLSIITFITDFLDGILARKLNCSTFFGSLFDGLSDKAFLIFNMILLMAITNVAIILIILEIGIALVQGLKYQNNLTVKSNIFGKIKMWLAGIIVSLLYLYVDKAMVNFVILFMPLIVMEVITLFSYIKEFSEEKRNLSLEFLKLQKIEEKKIYEEIKETNLKELLFDHDFYEKYKDHGNLKLVRDLLRK